MKKVILDKQYILSRVNVDEVSKCWNWTKSLTSSWYWYVKFRGKSYSSHHISYYLHIWDIRDWLFVCHKCDNRACCNPEHLFLWTSKDNMIDMFNKWRDNNHFKSNPTIGNNFSWKQVLAWWIIFKNFCEAWRYFWVSDNWIRQKIKLNWDWYNYL